MKIEHKKPNFVAFGSLRAMEYFIHEGDLFMKINNGSSHDDDDDNTICVTDENHHTSKFENGDLVHVRNFKLVEI